MPTMADVARRAGVALSTVSHVINRTRTVSPQTVAAVEVAMRDLSYIPNTLARSLARASSNTVGLAISLSNIYFSDFIHAVENASAKLGLMVFLSDTEDDPELELRVIQAFHMRRVDGIILVPSGDRGDRALRYMRDNAIPCVLLDRLVSKDFDQIGIRNAAAARDLVHHLVQHGHRRIAMISNQVGLATSIERIDGFRAGLRDHGIAWDPALLEIGSDDRDANIQATRRLLDRLHPPTALVAGNNLSTICAMRAFRDLGMRVPEDIALVGFDDFDWADLFAPRLTVVAQPTRALGERATEMLVERIRAPQARPRTVRLQASLIIRNSCGCP